LASRTRSLVGSYLVVFTGLTYLVAGYHYHVAGYHYHVVGHLRLVAGRPRLVAGRMGPIASRLVFAASASRPSLNVVAGYQGVL
jgi:hypothetical protein